MEKIKIILSGASGRLCTVIAKLAAAREDCEVVCGVDVAETPAPFPIYDSFDKITEAADVVIDCSHHTTAPKLAEYLLRTGTPAVVCTTGHTEDEERVLRDASEKVAVIKSRNMSLGINLLSELAKRAAAVLGEDFDVEIVEAHHRNKLDAPSGTALMLADAVKEAREEAGRESEYTYERASRREKRGDAEIGISSIRGGTIVGEHSVIFAGPDEVITLSHSAGSRDLFGTGAIRAALFIADKPAGFYTMADVIAEIL
ncbi:MAG: 4-hydroxy-tetrahydrodipicolinate reductase [Eubacteriales bacterium]